MQADSSPDCPRDEKRLIFGGLFLTGQDTGVTENQQRRERPGTNWLLARARTAASVKPSLACNGQEPHL